MERLRDASFLIFLTAVSALFSYCFAQDAASKSPTQPAPAPAVTSQSPEIKPVAAPIPANAPRISKQTRYQIIRDFETQLVYARTPFPMGYKGLLLKDGTTTPNGRDLQQQLALYGPAIKPGDPAQISWVQIKDNHIHFDLNGGANRRKKWYQHIEVSGTGGAPVMSPNDPPPNPHGSYLDIYFDKYVPEMTAQQLRDLLLPVLDFNARSKQQAYLDTVPPKVKQAILGHHVLVGMNTEMVLYAMGKPPRKVRERDGEVEYEEWIYGTPPDDVNFVRIVNDEVIRVETMKVGGEKIVRTQKEIILKHPDEETEASKTNQDRPANAPSLRRPGEDPADVPQPTNGASPTPPMPPPDLPPPSGSPGAGEMWSVGNH